MYQRILVTLDGSSFSEAILDPILRLASGTAIRVILLAVADPHFEVTPAVDLPAHPASIALSPALFQPHRETRPRFNKNMRCPDRFMHGAVMNSWVTWSYIAVD
jgi:hypothetical protein